MHIIKNTKIISMIAPNGKSKVSIHPDGYIEFDENTTDDTKDIIYEMSQAAFEVLGPKATPAECFKIMGWKDSEDGE